MIRAFVDASVIYSAIVSSDGASRELLKQHLAKNVVLVASVYVLEEVKRNLANKSPDKVGAVDLLLDLLDFELAVPSPATIKAVADFTELKDAPVVAAALMGKCDYLVTFDRKHLLGNDEVATKSGLIIGTAGELLHEIDRQ